MIADYALLPAGDTALVVDFGNRVDQQISAKVVALGRQLNARRIPGLVETVPTTRSLIIYYEPLTLSTETLAEHIRGLMQDLQTAESTGRTWQIQVCYDPEVAPDLGDVADRCGLTRAEVVALHTGTLYHVYMLGFLPGLAYLGDVPDRLALPRRESPRPRIPAGSVGIGGSMTCIYPTRTPCGWHLIGRSPVTLWDGRPECGALLAAGDKVKMTPVSLREYERVLSDDKHVVTPIPGSP